jgi:hypothetical protein
MALMLAIWRPQPNWMPRNPKLMFQMVENGVAAAAGEDAMGGLFL